MPQPWERSRDPRVSAATGRAPQRGWQRPELVVWGAHGGAGTSTLAAWLSPAWDMGAMRPQPSPPYPEKVARGRALLVACRGSASAARLATVAVAAVHQQGGQVAVLVVVSDGWPEPAAARSRFRLLEPQVMAVVRVPFVPPLRLADDPAAVPLPRRVRRALEQIRLVTGPRTPTS